MPKKSLVINGFLGGINRDGDLSDLQSEDNQGRNELSVCEDVLCNQPGKIRVKRPAVQAHGSSLDPGDPSAGDPAGIAGTADDFLIYGDNYYREKGIYKIGEDIEYSGSTVIKKPLATVAGRLNATSSVLANSIGLDTDGTSSGDNLNRVFWGKTASTNTTGAALYADGALHETPGTVPTPAKMMRFAIDGDNDAQFESDEYDDYVQMSLFHEGSDWTVGLWDDDGSVTPSPAGSYGWSNIGSGSIVDNQWQPTGDIDLSNADFIRFGRNASDASNNKDVGVVFRVGDMVYDGANPSGMFGADFNITDKDIYIEIDFNSATDGTFDAGEFWNGFTELNITATSDGGDAEIHYSDSNFDSYSKTWEISKAALITYGCESAQKNGSSAYVTGANGGGRFKIPWSSAIHTGGSFSSANVKAIAVVLIGGDMGAPTGDGEADDPLTVWYARLYELSFEATGSVGWANSVTQFSQSRVYESTVTGNKVESLLQPYGNYLDLVADNTLNLKFYKPTTAAYQGKVYYQDCDDTGTPLGSAFLIAEVSADQGVKSILAEFWEQWSGDNTVALNFADPPAGSTYQLESGYPQDSTTINAKWNHAVTVGRQVYIGSVIKTGDDLPVVDVKSGGSSVDNDQYPLIDTTGITATTGKTYRFKMDAATTFDVSDDGGSSYTAATNVSISENNYVSIGVDGIYIRFPSDGGYGVNDEWEFVTALEQDLILKSAIGKRYGFPDLQYVDLELPGTGITAIYSSGDRLMVFTGTSLILVNVAQDYEFLEATFQGHGVSSPKKIVEVNEGIAFVNDTGVYYFDGRQMESLSDDLMMTFGDSVAAGVNWAAATNIGYLPQEKLICVWYDDDFASSYVGDTIVAYSLATKAWVCVSKVNSPPTTRIKFHNNIPYWLDGDTLKKLAIINTTTGVQIETGKISCGDLSRKKNFNKVYININNGAEFALYYKIDTGSWSSANELSNGLTSVSIGETGKTIQLKIVSDATIDAGTELSDIVIVYRELRII